MTSLRIDSGFKSHETKEESKVEKLETTQLQKLILEPEWLLKSENAEAFEQYFYGNTEESPIESLKYNRYQCLFDNVLCPKKTVVRCEGDNEYTYLHGNHVTLVEGQRYIATQYPKQLDFFWSAAQRFGSIIVDLTNTEDREEIGVGCYYPEATDKEPMEVDSMKVSFVEQIKDFALEKMSLFKYKIEDKSSSKEIFRLNVENWTNEADLDIKQFRGLVDFIRRFQKGENSYPIIHCQAGRGRTGATIICDSLMNLIDQGKVNKTNLVETVNRLALSYRDQRGGKDKVITTIVDSQIRSIIQIALLRLDEKAKS